MNIEHKIDYENRSVSVTVSVPPRTDKKFVIRHNDVVKYLQGKVKIGECIKNNTVSNNIAPHRGEWIFKLDNSVKPIVRSKGEKARSASKVEKTVTPQPEPATATEVAQPKTRRRRRKARPEAIDTSNEV